MTSSFNKRDIGNLKETPSDTLIDPSRYEDFSEDESSNEDPDDCPKCQSRGHIAGKLCNLCKGSGIYVLPKK